MARTKSIVGEKRAGLESWLESMANCKVIEGHARFVSPNAIEVAGETLEADRVFINVGGRAAIPDFPGVDQVRALTNSTLLELDALPRHLAIVGGSYIGLEFAQIFRRLGADVTVIEKAPRLVAREDPDISDAVRGILEAEGITVRCDAECIRFAPRGADVEVGVDCESGEPVVVGSHVLVAVGRRPNTDDLGLDAAGVAVDAGGYIVVDDELRTSVPHIWALGDCNGRGAFTHTAYNDYEIVAGNLFDGARRRVTDRIPVYALYVDPPLGRVGLTEARGESERARRPRRQAADDARCARRGEGRDAGVHESGRRRSKRRNPRRRDPRPRRRRGDPRRYRSDGRGRYRDSLQARRRNPPHSVRARADGLRGAVAVSRAR